MMSHCVEARSSHETFRAGCWREGEATVKMDATSALAPPRRESMELDTAPPPSPVGLRSLDDLAAGLRKLRSWSGLGPREVHRRVARLRREAKRPAPGYETIRRCFETGRVRVDADLITDLAQVLLGNDRTAALEWRRACELIESGVGPESVIRVDPELPSATADFIGRSPELRRILAAAGQPGPVVIVIHGMPGAGKTTLAAQAGQHLARSASARSARPVRRLGVNLRGYDSDAPPADSAAVLEGLLREVGVKPHRFAGQPPQVRLSLFAAALRDRPTLLLLDNARTSDQVRPLIPPVTDCTVLITSRHTLEVPEAVRIRLDPLTGAEALDLLRRELGDDLIDGAPDAAAEITELAGRIPLALRVIAGWIRDHPLPRLTEHRDWLLDDHAGIRLGGGVELALRSSYQQFPEPTARLLRLLSLHPGRDLDRFAAAALAGSPEEEVRTRLDSLASGGLLEPLPGGHFQLHDLVRAFAVRESRRSEPPSEREAAIGRLLDYYRCAAARAMDAYSPQNRDRRPRVAAVGLSVPVFPDRDAARSWLDAEYANLVDAAVKLTGDRLPGHGVDLSSILFAYLDDAAHHGVALTLHQHAESLATGAERGRVLVNLGVTSAQLGRFQDSIGYHEQALLIHREHGDRAGAGRAHGNLGIAAAQLGRTDDAIAHLTQAVAIHREVGNRTNEAIASGNLCQLYQQIRRFDEARRYGERQLDLARDLGHRLTEGVALGNLGNLDRSEGRHDSALTMHQEALTIAREAGIRGQEVAAINESGIDLRLLDRLDEAREAHAAALSLAVDLGNLMQQAKAYEGLGRCRLAGGERGSPARENLAEALRIYTELGVPAAAEIKDLLATLG